MHELTRLDGYMAAEILIKQLLDEARMPRRCSTKSRKSAAYKHGYAEGLLAAHCLNALGNYPNLPSSREQIIEALRSTTEALKPHTEPNERI